MDSKFIEPLVSVVMPAYNADLFIDSALQSLIEQTYQNIEIIVVNDGSTDGTAEKIKKYSKFDERIKIINTKNNGVAKALNRGIKEAKGEYIARMDADDISARSRLEKQIKFLINNKSIGIVGSAAKAIDSEGRELGKVLLKPENHNCLLWYMLFRNPFIHPTVVFRSEIIKKLMYIDTASEDNELWARAVKYTRFYNMPEPLLYYRVHDSQVSNNLYNESNNYKVFLLKQQFYKTVGLSCFDYKFFLVSRVPRSLKLRYVGGYAFFLYRTLISWGKLYNNTEEGKLVEAYRVLKLCMARFKEDTRHLTFFTFLLFLPLFLFAFIRILLMS